MVQNMRKIITLDTESKNRLMSPHVSEIARAIRRAGGEARVVGGAVRDVLMGRQPEDIDFAANIPPQAVMQALNAEGIKAVPTGIDHGTITAVIDHKGYEITSLRQDVESFGRKAQVAFTDDWETDASRRDFTFNALYADSEGSVFDYFGGYEDLKSGYVRFIGAAEERIREDVLRILRFFRFYAWINQGVPDAEALSACRELAPLLESLSSERVWREIRKLLSAPDPSFALTMMQREEILRHILPEAENMPRLGRLLAIERERAVLPHALRRLAATLTSGQAACVARRLKFSIREEVYLKALEQLSERINSSTDRAAMRRLLYEFDNDRVRDAVLLVSASGKIIDLDAALAVADSWTPVRFPLQGGDIVSLGIKAGPVVGKILQSVEKWWVAQDFQPAAKECFAEARRIIQDMKKT